VSPVPTAGPLRLVLATANPDKAAEVREILVAELGDRVELLARPEHVAEVDETGTTLVENARLKAVALCEATGCAAVADDTGLFVDALGGAPGVWSSRYAGPHASYADNVAKLLSAMEGREDRAARFATVALVRFPDGSEVMAEGVVAGVIARAPRGGNGFGYDPIFVPDEAGGRTFAETSPAEKHALSHRGRAFRLLAARLDQIVAGSPAP
jgi:XTP/dITP diphosphohydrolase